MLISDVSVRRPVFALMMTVALIVAPAAAARSLAGAAGGSTCASLTELTLSDVRIASATSVAAGPFTPPGAGASAAPMTLPAFCRVVGVATPSSDSVVNFEVWIPAADAWNGKFEGVGNGGFSGSISYADMSAALKRGYATASTDTGHVGDDLIFAKGHPEKIVDWGYRAIHVTTEAAKLVVRSRLGRFPAHSYFYGCNTGGHQALMEAQRFPEDYDGVIAGTPAADRVHEIVGYLWAWVSTHRDGASLLPPAALQLVGRSAVAACDALDGVTDGVIENPRRCRFDPATLACHGTANDTCLTGAQVDAVRKIYDGTRNPRTGAVIFPGWPPGSEAPGDRANQGWSQFINISEPRRVTFFNHFVFGDPSWDWRTMDWDKDTAYADAKMGFINATARDLTGFKNRGGKLLMYTGWADAILPAQDVTEYYEAVTKTMGGAAKTKSFFRLFMVPGMGHCSGGPGPSSFDVLPSLEQWAEQGVAPERIVASHVAGGVVDRTRPLCVYPQVARWKGTGSTDEAASFVCRLEP